jgi:peptidase M48-like protein
MMKKIKNYLAVYLMAVFFGAFSYLPAYGADAPAADYNGARLRVARIAPTLEEIAGRKPPIVVTPELKKDACVLPNGNIIITTGLVESCATDDELAFIIAHELSHITAGDFENSGTPALTGSRDIPDSELREMKADLSAVHYMKNAGYDPHASIKILTRLADKSALKLRLYSLSNYLRTLLHN